MVDVRDFLHVRINHSELIPKRWNHINRIENFWNQAKPHLCKFNDIPGEQSGLFLKEYKRATISFETDC